MRAFLVVAILAGLTFVFVVQKRNEPPKTVATTEKSTTQTAPSPRPASEHNWMKRSLDRTNEVKRQVAQQRKEDGTR